MPVRRDWQSCIAYLKIRLTPLIAIMALLRVGWLRVLTKEDDSDFPVGMWNATTGFAVAPTRRLKVNQQVITQNALCKESPLCDRLCECTMAKCALVLAWLHALWTAIIRWSAIPPINCSASIKYPVPRSNFNSRLLFGFVQQSLSSPGEMNQWTCSPSNETGLVLESEWYFARWRSSDWYFANDWAKRECVWIIGLGPGQAKTSSRKQRIMLVQFVVFLFMAGIGSVQKTNGLTHTPDSRLVIGRGKVNPSRLVNVPSASSIFVCLCRSWGRIAAFCRRIPVDSLSLYVSLYNSSNRWNGSVPLSITAW